MRELRRSVIDHRLVAGGEVQARLVRDGRHRRRHPERRQQTLMQQVVDRRAGHPLEGQPHQLVRVVGIPEVLPRSERGRQVAQVGGRAPSGGRVLGSHRETAPVREEVMQRDGAERLGELQPGQDLVDAHVQVQPPLLDLLHHHGRRERLGDRADLEAGLGLHRLAGGGVGEAAHRDPEDLLAIGDRERDAARMAHREVVLEGGPDPLERLAETGHRRRARPSRRTA